MTQLVIDVVDVSGGTHPDDKVRLWAPQHRPDGELVVSTSPVDVKLVDGQATVDVLPGPARVQIMTRGVVDSAPKKVTIPDEASVTLRAVIEDGLEWEPEVVSRVAALASRAESAADRAENVADTFGSLEGVATSVQAAEDAATSAAGSASAAALSATAANDSEVSAASSATAAAQSAVNAANSEWVAGEHKGAAEAASTAAASSASGAAASAGAAASSEVAAATSAGEAAASAGAASDAAGRAENVASSVHWQDDRLSVMGQMGPSLTGPQGEKGDPGEVSWSELNPVLDGKANTGAVPVTDDGYNSHDASDPATDYPRGVSYSMNNGTSNGWNAAIQADTGYTGSSTFVMVQTLRQGGYSRSTTQLVFTYDDVHKPVFMRKWHGEAWGPFRSLTDDGHQHKAEDISDATTVGRNVLKASSQSAARTAIGAGTSNLALGTTSSTAAAGNHTHTPASIGAAPASHTHSQYATTTTVTSVSGRVTTLENAQPIIVSSLPSSPLPGRIYLVTG